MACAGERDPCDNAGAASLLGILIAELNSQHALAKTVQYLVVRVFTEKQPIKVKLSSKQADGHEVAFEAEFSANNKEVALETLSAFVDHAKTMWNAD